MVVVVPRFAGGGEDRPLSTVESCRNAERMDEWRREKPRHGSFLCAGATMRISIRIRDFFPFLSFLVRERKRGNIRGED